MSYLLKKGRLSRYRIISFPGTRLSICASKGRSPRWFICTALSLFVSVQHLLPLLLHSSNLCLDHPFWHMSSKMRLYPLFQFLGFPWNNKNRFTLVNRIQRDPWLLIIYFHGFHIHVHLQKQIETKFKEKEPVFPYSYRWCLTVKLMNCFLQALQCFSDLHQLGLYLIFLLRGILVWGGGVLIGFLP